MEKLISMTDFVLEQYHTTKQRWAVCNILLRYANFLKKQLKLGYFIPCDENDIPLTEPKENNYNMQADVAFDLFTEDILRYQEANKKILFEFQSDFKSWRIGDIEDSNIEELLTDDREYILTETAKKEIGLI